MKRISASASNEQNALRQYEMEANVDDGIAMNRKIYIPRHLLVCEKGVSA